MVIGHQDDKVKLSAQPGIVVAWLKVLARGPGRQCHGDQAPVATHAARDFGDKGLKRRAILCKNILNVDMDAPKSPFERFYPSVCGFAYPSALKRAVRPFNRFVLL